MSVNFQRFCLCFILLLNFAVMCVILTVTGSQLDGRFAYILAALKCTAYTACMRWQIDFVLGVDVSPVDCLIGLVSKIRSMYS